MTRTGKPKRRASDKPRPRLRTVPPSPGPWTTTENGDDCAKGHAIGAGGIVIAKVYGRGYPVTKGWSPASQADANLLATAPDGLTLAHRVVEYFSGKATVSNVAVLKAARALIKRARFAA